MSAETDEFERMRGSRVTWDEFVATFPNRNEVAEEYARLMRAHGLEWEGYHHVNDAILRRWSLAGLSYIKRRAWKIATGNRL